MAAFCSKCGSHVEENEHFCPKCGNDVTAVSATPAVAPVAAGPVPVAQPIAPPPPPPVYAAPPPPPQSYAAPPPPSYPAPPVQGYGAPGPIPVMQAEPAKKNNMLWLAIAVAAAAGGWYYYHKPPPTPAPQTQNPPVQPGGAPPQPATPAQPGGPGPGGPNAALVQQQQWTSQEQPVNGNVQVQNGKWVNGAAVGITSAVLECDQYDANQAVLAQNQTNLTLSNPPLTPGGNATFQSFNAGQIVQNVNSVNCGIVAVTPAQ